MKTIKLKLHIVLAIMLGLHLWSCEKLEIVDVSFWASELEVHVGETVAFYASGEGTTYAIYPGSWREGSNHDFENSYFLNSEDKNQDKEDYYITEDSIYAIRWNFDIDYNFPSDTIDYPKNVKGVIADLMEEHMLGNTYDGFLLVEAIVKNIVFPMDSIEQNSWKDWVDIIMPYFSSNVDDNTPSIGQFSTGFALDPYKPELEHIYDSVGIHTATLIVGKVSSKQYSGNGYRGKRESSSEDYLYEYVTRELQITVLDTIN